MIIEDVRRKDTFFERLQIGDTFEYEGIFFVRCPTIELSSEEIELTVYNAFRLEDNCFVEFCNKDRVKPVQAIITISE